MRAVIGIDVGWSESRPSCGIAVRDAHIALRKPTRYGEIVVAKARATELVRLLADWARDFPEEARSAIVVLDGPLGARALAYHDRRVDSECGKNQFNKRTQPVLVSHPSSRTYIAATYGFVDAIGSDARRAVWMGGTIPSEHLVVAETHPTVGLCLLLPAQPEATLPTRKRARLHPSDGRAIRAKSDWYWAIGARAAVADVLSEPSLASERDHERVAALYCLAVAEALSNEGRVIAVGDADGVYVFPRSVDRSWGRAIERIGLTHGAIEPTERGIDDAVARRAESVAVEVPAQDDDFVEEAPHGDWFDLYLHDTGGVYTKHNCSWLAGLKAPVQIITDKDMRVSLTRSKAAANSGQWIARPTTLDIARAHGYAGTHLSGKHPLVVRCKFTTPAEEEEDDDEGR